MKPTDKQVVEWARKARVDNAWDINWLDPYYAKFAALAYKAGRKDARERMCVAIRKAVAAEREECAKVCDDLPVPPYVSDNDAIIWDVTCVDCAAAIRERGAP
jgi:hypothetical protein